MKTLFSDKEQKILSPVMIGAPALMEAASKIQVHVRVLDILKELEAPEFWINWYEEGLEKFGEHWGYIDLLGLLYISCKWLHPKSYLEIGVASGRSTSIVGALMPNCNITGIDVWPNSRLDIPINNLKAVEYRGEFTQIHGSSHQELPKLKGKKFDLILVDGDHREEGAIRDLKAVIPMIPRGGVLIFDDYCAPWLGKTWDEIVRPNGRFSTAEYRESGAGVAIAVARR